MKWDHSEHKIITLSIFNKIYYENCVNYDDFVCYQPDKENYT